MLCGDTYYITFLFARLSIIVSMAVNYFFALRPYMQLVRCGPPIRRVFLDANNIRVATYYIHVRIRAVASVDERKIVCAIERVNVRNNFICT